MSKEADTAAAAGPVLTETRAVLCRVKPALKHPMRVLAHVPPSASALPEVRAGNAAIMIFSWVTLPGVLTRMDEGALSPVMGVGPRARSDFERVHAELISGVDTVLNIRQRWIDRILFLLGDGRRGQVGDQVARWGSILIRG